MMTLENMQLHHLLQQKIFSYPADFLIIRSLQVFSTTDQTGDRTFMEKRDTSFISEYNGSGATGLPKYYANWDETLL